MIAINQVPQIFKVGRASAAIFFNLHSAENAGRNMETLVSLVGRHLAGTGVYERKLCVQSQDS